MTHVLATEGGYQSFVLHSSGKGWLWFALASGVVALITAFALMRNVLAADTGTDLMREIAAAIQEGAEAFLKRQFRIIGIVVVPLAVLVFFTATSVHSPNPNDPHQLSFAASGFARAIAFVVGALFSGLTGTIGMSIAVRGNVRTAAAARGGTLPPALKVAFRTGGVTGLFCVGLGLIGASAITLIFQNSVTAVLVGFGFGGSLLALFMRVGGGIFTKAADVGADLVGKVEVGIPEDDPRNAATIADNVGDNVGDCAGMAADLFESYAVTIVASLILGFAAFRSLGIADTSKGLIYPLVVAAFGILASIIGIYSVRASGGDRTAMSPINRGYRLSGLLTLIAAYLVAQFYVHNLKVFFAVLVGVGLGQVASLITEYFTSTETSPVREIADSARTGPATTVLSGISSGLESSVWAICAIAIAIGVAIAIGGVHNIELTLYLVALVGIGLLSTTGMVVSEDSFGPVADNAAGVAEMAGEFGGEAERVMVSLDAVGNTTKAITKGVAIASAVIATVALFASFVETIGGQLNLGSGARVFTDIATQINVANPITFVGLLIGGSIAFLFSGLAIRAVGRSAGTVVEEVRRQFREHPGIMDRTERPEYGRVIAICTAAAQRELVTPALLAVLAPVIVGFGINYAALGAFLAAAILTGQLMANFLSNSGGAWDNAKKYIEDGNVGGKGSEAHKAAVIGDTVGDPFKDTAGPALNPLIKVMNLVALLILPAVIKLHFHTATRYAIAGGALIILLGAIAFSKRSTGTMSDEAAEGEAVSGVRPAEVVGHH
ncbi:MAG TPA: sodium-translocating pyrophosphatase [Acidimicrobiales bacterium]|nr:sodium-translocating pyrophosphatase [Acidimicrobiales bacterium]